MTRITMNTLQHFHEYWWGNDNFLGANTVIHLPVFSDLHIFDFTGSRLLVREEYLYIFKRLQDFCQTPRYYARAIILDGHPGIGKSMFLFYALIRCLQESRDVIFYFSHRTLKFSKDGVQEIDLNNFIPYPSIHSPIWCLIDGYGREGPPLDLIGAYMFPILASSRSDEPYSGWAQRTAASRLVMNPWSDEEICIGTFKSRPSHARPVSVTIATSSKLLRTYHSRHLYLSVIPRIDYYPRPCLRSSSKRCQSRFPHSSTRRV
ncbi:hypothetical protein F5146DRAFT_438160 [Armillaria mellea]|nr:hypothetical protein F5146DRAFT_438160 [Armillaria mellea]